MKHVVKMYVKKYELISEKFRENAEITAYFAFKITVKNYIFLKLNL